MRDLRKRSAILDCGDPSGLSEAYRREAAPTSPADCRPRFSPLPRPRPGRFLSGTEVCGGDAKARRLRTCAEPTVPGGQDQARLAQGEGAGEMDSVGATQGVERSELTGVLLDGAGELDWAGSRTRIPPKPVRWSRSR